MRFEGEAGGEDEGRIFTVTDIAEDKVVLDANHPFAGMALKVSCTVVGVRPATPTKSRTARPTTPSRSSCAFFPDRRIAMAGRRGHVRHAGHRFVRPRDAASAVAPRSRSLVVVFIQDITQKKHTVLRNYPVIGHLRYLLEKQGEYFRQYFFMNDREELPFNRATRGWVYRLAKAEGGVIGFGSTNNTNEPGSILFVNHPYPVLEEDRLPTPPLHDRRGVLQGAVSRELGRQHQRHELRRDLGAGGARAVARRGARRLLDGHGRRRPVAVSSRRRLRRHHADRHGQLRRARRRRKFLRGAREGTRGAPAGEGVRDQALAGREARQGRRAAGGEGDRADRRDSRHSGAPGLDQPQSPSRHRQRRSAARQDRVWCAS